MVAGIIGRAMREIDRRPTVRRMAGVAIFRGDEVTAGLAGRGAAVVTGLTVAGDSHVIPGSANEGRRGMAVVAVQGGRYVVR